MSEPFKIIICGEGGQGALSVAEIVARAAWMHGKKAVCMPYFSTEKRGGVSMAYAQIGDEPIVYPKFSEADLWVALSQRSVDRIHSYLKPDTKCIVNSFLVKDVSTLEGHEVHEIDATRIAKEELKKPRTFNMIVMGAMLRLIPGLDKAAFSEALERQFKDKYERDPSLREMNQKGFDVGYELIK
ncbi:MAG: 2-oxoacid:acceptor oxidoreductase family protein [Patescibacteria group bacterium]|nr:2-oxoacid:acceptor oxidoreductase family protein [Patescibacteria group bacterium]